MWFGNGLNESESNLLSSVNRNYYGMSKYTGVLARFFSFVNTMDTFRQNYLLAIKIDITSLKSAVFYKDNL